MTKKNTILVSLVCFLSGIVIGFFLAPAKGGVSCGNNNGNTKVFNCYKKDSERKIK